MHIIVRFSLGLFTWIEKNGDTVLSFCFIELYFRENFKFSFKINYYSQIPIDACELNICRLRAISIVFTS